MHQIKQINALQAYRAELRGTVGFVPTMGALHAGHLSLIEVALNENDHVLVSIFVNPTQFDQSSDLENYPNQLAEDLRQLEKIGVTAVFTPDYAALYPDNYNYQIIEKELSQRFCGAHRAGHFDGVLSVVIKLLNLTVSDKAYFGEKDYQQLQLIKGMVAAFFIPCEIVACPIIREPDGLAMSSRNVRLSAVERKIAPELYATLINQDSLADKTSHLNDIGFEVDYLEQLDDRLLIAARLGQVRLIDNVPISAGARS
ncbi:pantoate--beta-alanine ligase [Marinicella sp. S1101]|uniref:pantoate--beta-alanine ligase n=1 Tax=Marinicella marina TaxID=2996016 RepID=UPI002260F561|nr:pantoate--beta-alanine ligase [Marinicella marina]MCX7552689.1 pantoate--beta-alanine ligase [Marinicella marina]MDJ1139565.1 pantoate--beta-alanine ligase [Marinicella marina]